MDQQFAVLMLRRAKLSSDTISLLTFNLTSPSHDLDEVPENVNIPRAVFRMTVEVIGDVRINVIRY